MRKIKKKNGIYQFPMRGRDLPKVHLNDLFYDANIPAIRDKSPRAVFGKADKYFDLSYKETDQQQAPCTYRPKETLTRHSNVSYSMSKSKKDCHFDKVLGEGAHEFYKTSKDISKNIKHGYMAQSVRSLNSSASRS